MLVWWFPHCCGIEVGCYGDFVLATNWHLWSSLRYKTPIVCGAFWLRKCKFLNCQFNYVYQLENDLRFLSDLIRCYTLFFVHFDLQNCIFFGSHLLIFLHGPPKVFFYRIFLLGIFFFSICVQWLKTRFLLARSKWSRTFPLLQHLQSLREPALIFFCWEVAPWEQELRMFSTMLTEFCLKILDYRNCVCVFYWKYNHNTSFYHNFYQKLLKQVWDKKSFSLAIIDFTRSN